jgi:CHAP domain
MGISRLRFIGLVCALFLVLLSLPRGSLATALADVCSCCGQEIRKTVTPPPAPVGNEPPHIVMARGYLRVRETTGHNRSPDIDRWNRYVGAPLGSSYCSSFVSWNLGQARVKFPATRTAWARGFLLRGQSVSARDVLIGRYLPRSGDIVVWIRPQGGHVGFVTRCARAPAGQSPLLSTIEANTSSGDKGSQANGDGVYERKRRIQPFAKFRILGFTPVRY